MSDTHTRTGAGTEQTTGPGKHRGQAAPTEENEAPAHGRHRRPPHEAERGEEAA